MLRPTGALTVVTQALIIFGVTSGALSPPELPRVSLDLSLTGLGFQVCQPQLLQTRRHLRDTGWHQRPEIRQRLLVLTRTSLLPAYLRIPIRGCNPT